jgi:hypothetical protein
MLGPFRSVLAIAAVLGALMVFAGQAQAAAVAPGALKAPAAPAQANPLIQQVHGCHRRPRVGPLTGLVHRHVGPNCRWSRARRGGWRGACRRWRRRCARRCDFARFPRRCERRCYRRNAPNRCFF